MTGKDWKLEDLLLTISQEMYVKASIEVTFLALLEQLGPGNETAEGKPLSMRVEPWPGGRWYRDMGGDDGHLWAHVKAIVRPALLEFVGPLFASFPFVSNVQYRLSERDGGTLIAFQHRALGIVSEALAEGTAKEWAATLERVRRSAEAGQ